MLYIPFDIIQVIANHSNVKTKMNIKSLNKFLYNNLRIYTIYDKVNIKYSFYYMDLKIDEFPNISHKLNENILNKFKYITVLNLIGNKIIHDKHIIHLKNLHTLFANNLISDEGIKHMNLHILYANKKISNEGINI